MSLISQALKETISVQEVATLVLDMFAHGLRRPKEMPSDELLVVRAYHRELCALPADSIRAVVAELCSSEADFIPPAGKLAVRVKVHASRQLQAKPKGACLDPQCDCAGDGWYVGVVDAAGPIARNFPEHVAKMRGLRPVAEVRCPHEGCGCPAVVVKVSTDYRRYPKGEKGPPAPIATVQPAELPLRTMEVWLWECEASRLGLAVEAAA